MATKKAAKAAKKAPKAKAAKKAADPLKAAKFQFYKTVNGYGWSLNVKGVHTSLHARSFHSPDSAANAEARARRDALSLLS